MISLTPNTSACLYESTIITVVDRPPKQPPDDDHDAAPQPRFLRLIG
jgi:hypothetical protein